MAVHRSKSSSNRRNSGLGEMLGLCFKPVTHSRAIAKRYREYEENDDDVFRARDHNSENYPPLVRLDNLTMVRKGRFSDEFLKGKFLGRGGQGYVHLVTQKTTGKKFACKTIYRKDIAEADYAAESLRQEIEALAALGGHPHIITLETVIEDTDGFHIVTELCEKGSVSDLIESKNLTVEDAAKVLRHVTCALVYMHEDCSIIHRDLKAENVFVKKDGSVKLGDLGFAAALGIVENKAVGSLLYMSPEMLRMKGYDARTELWSLGILLFHMLSGGEFPFYGESVNEILNAILTSDRSYVDFVSDPLAQELVRALLSVDPAQRPTLWQVLGHPWLAQYEK